MERSVDNNIFGFGVIKRLIGVVAAVILSSLPLSAQEQIPLMDSYNNIVQSRFGALAIIPLNPKWELSLGGQVRTLANMSDVDKIMAIAMVNYSPWKFLSFESEYNFVDWHTAGQWRLKHRLNLGVIGKVKWGRFTLSLRERLKLNIKNYKTDPYTLANPVVMLRTRLMATYNNKSAWKPYAFVEFYGMMNAPTAVANRFESPVQRKPYFNRLRASAGANVSISEKSIIHIYYLFVFNRVYNFGYNSATGDLESRSRKNSRVHAIGIDYKFKL